jgi:hypothetical protein
MVNITLRVLSKPDVEQLPRIFRVRTYAPWGLQLVANPWLLAIHLHAVAALVAVLSFALFWLATCTTNRALAAFCLPWQNLGLDWDERVLPSIGNEVLKAVVAQYQAEQLLTQVCVLVCMPRTNVRLLSSCLPLLCETGCGCNPLNSQGTC